jgi:hypothetical protein
MNKWEVNLDSYEMGDDLVLMLKGGEKHHVGAVAMAIPYKDTASTSIISAYGHKDGELAKPLAEKVAKTLKKIVVIIVGLHIDEATKDDIQKLVENSNRVINEFLEEFK